MDWAFFHYKTAVKDVFNNLRENGVDKLYQFQFFLNFVHERKKNMIMVVNKSIWTDRVSFVESTRDIQK